MQGQEVQFKDIISHCKEYGFIFPGSEIYDGLGAVYDYGPLGVELKNRIKSYWYEWMTRTHEDIVGIDTAIFMHPEVWKASGHVDAFNDPLIDNKDSKKRYRADVLIEDQIEKYLEKANKEVAKAAKRFGDNFDEKLYRETNPRVLGYFDKAEALRKRFAEAAGENDMTALKRIIEDEGIVCPVSGSRNWTEVRQFNLMFSTQLGSIAGDAGELYLRPETAQGIFVNFLNVAKSNRMKVPFGIAQVGKAFRNEIVARQFIFRMREFEQMEMQFFVRPGEELKWYEFWKNRRMKWHQSLGLGDDNYRFHDHDKLAHYANAAADIEFKFPFGFKELEGIHSRTDFDLKQHEAHSGKKLQYFDPESQEKYVPYVIETSIGLDRMFLAIISNALREETLPDDSKRTVMRIPFFLAPVQIAIFPLIKKDGLPEMAREVQSLLRYDFACQYDEKDAVGRRYRRQDAIGTPFCVTIDHESLEAGTVTVRNRDTMEQIRLPLDALSNYFGERLSMSRGWKSID
ncbi:MAG: glycine--tRNA ligase [Cryomorphaceae bacterium]|nr:glycine--tRNA ligase [Cryomorphaceae bacterium]